MLTFVVGNRTIVFFSYSHVIVVSGVLTSGLIQLAWTRVVGQAAQTAAQYATYLPTNILP